LTTHISSPTLDGPPDGPKEEPREADIAGHGGSPTLYATDRGTYVVQGWRVSDPEAQAQLVVPRHETVVEVPAALLRFAPSVRSS
jgi:hypothetical protein